MHNVSLGTNFLPGEKQLRKVKYNLSISNRLLHINVQHWHLAGGNSFGDVLLNIDQLALVSYLKAMAIQHI
jgi:hypothetical protein